MVNIWGRGIFAGLLAGIVLGFLLKSIEMTTGIFVYSLLLNVDFIPFFRIHPVSETVEFILHLIVSIGIGIAYSILVNKFKEISFKKEVCIAFILTLPAILLFFPLSLLAVERAVPNHLDSIALSLWILSHIIYCLVLAISFNLRWRRFR